MSSWAISLHPLLLEKAILMDKARESSGRPFGDPCGEACVGSGDLCWVLV